MSLKSEAKADAVNQFSDTVGELDFPTLTYFEFMRVIVPELSVAREMVLNHPSDEYHQKYSVVLLGKVNQFCKEH